MITITVKGTILTAVTDEPIVAGSIGRTRFTAAFDCSWAGYARKLVFSSACGSKAVLAEEDAVPWEVLQEPGDLKITAVGLTDGVRCPTARMTVPLLISYPGKDSSSQGGVAPSPSELEQIATVAQQARKTAEDPQPYVTLSIEKSSLTVSLHQVAQQQNYELHLYLRSRHGGNRCKPWRHPADFTAEDQQTCYGYGLLAGQHYRGNKTVHIIYPPCPNWMPNDGYLQTEWPAPETGSMEIELRRWLLPLLKPVENGDGLGWDECCICGVNQVKAPVLMQIRLVRKSDGMVYPSQNTLRIGVRKNCRQFPFVEQTETGYRINGELYISII